MWGAIIAAVVSIVGMIVQNSANKKAADKQQEANKQLAAFQADANQKYADKANDYNSPVNQMGRFQQAGLNPNLIYGQGSPGNQSQALSYPEIKPADYQKAAPKVDPTESVQLFNQTRLTDAQVNAQNATTRQKGAQTELNKLQAQVLAKNPALDNEGFKAIISGLKASAELKGEQTRGQHIANTQAAGMGPAALVKVYKETELLEQRFHLNQQDSAIKAEILKGKEFQNAILEVQKKFMTDGDITPQHIYQFIQLLLMKML